MEYLFNAVLAISLSVVFSDFVCPLPRVTHYEVVRPVKLGGRSKRSTSKQDGAAVTQYPDELQYQLLLDGRNHTVHLEKNRFLLGSNYSETHYNQDGSRVITFPNLEDHCYYHGYIMGMEDSAVSVGVCPGITGFLRAAQQLYLIEPLGVSPEGDHAVYKPQHMFGQSAACGISNGTEEGSSFVQPRAAGVFRPNAQSKTHFSTTRYVELYMVVDNTEFRRFQTLENVRKRIQSVVNHVDLYYRAVNIRVLLVGLEVWTNADKFVVHGDEGITLDRFLEWRLDDLVKRARHDSAMFVTGIDFLSDTVGFATRYAMCSERSAGVNQDYNENPLALAATIAHEMGHTLGMTHDEAGCSCGPTETKCLMVATVDKHPRTFPKLFSDCSLNQLGQFLESPGVGCLLDPPKPNSLYGGAVCGNGLLDTGEECDCGPVEMCENPCCDASTCRLSAGSQCADGQCCEDCQFKQPGTVCRPAAHDCDLAEYCSGGIGACPDDSFKMNGAECNHGDGYCYNGMCPSASGHCKRLWGPESRSPPECFHFNQKGEEEAHCGISGRTYKACSYWDMVCGKLFCFGGNPHPFVGKPGYWTRDKPQCYYVRDNTDPHELGMVPTGTKCGLNRVCYNHKCQDITVYANEGCAEKCSNHGVCNHKGECHCDPGWAPPFCSTRGYTNYGTTAGSSDGAVIIGVCAAGAVLLLLSLLIVAARLWRRRKAANVCKQRPQSVKMTPLSHRDQTSDSQLTRPLHISQPVFLETTSKRMDDPTVITVMPSRPPPAPPKSSPRLPSQGLDSQMRPVPPPKPSPAVPTKVSGTSRPALRPPTVPR